MKFATLLGVGATVVSIASAAPNPEANALARSDKHVLRPHWDFKVKNFVMGCDASCYWSFNLKIAGNNKKHPKVKEYVQCKGGVLENQDWVDCGRISEDQKLRAFIDKNSLLHLQYLVAVPSDNLVYTYTATEQVHAATSIDAKKQKKKFHVKETSAEKRETNVVKTVTHGHGH